MSKILRQGSCAGIKGDTKFYSDLENTIIVHVLKYYNNTCIYMYIVKFTQAETSKTGFAELQKIM